MNKMDELIDTLEVQLQLIAQNKRLIDSLESVTLERDTYKKLLENLLEQKQNERHQ